MAPITIPQVSQFTTPVPSKSDPQNFAERADIMVSEFPQVIDDFNTSVAMANLFFGGMDQASPIAAWADDPESYDYPTVVAGTDGNSYRCVGTDVVGDNPVGSVTGNWYPITSRGDTTTIRAADFGAIPNMSVSSTAGFDAFGQEIRDRVYRVEGDLTNNTQNSSFACIGKIDPGTYIIEDPVDWTDIDQSHSPWYIEASGAIFFIRTTGETGFDLVGSRKMFFNGGVFIAETGYRPRSIFQFGRDSTGKASDGHKLSNMELKGDCIIGPIYNNGSEGLDLSDNVSIKIENLTSAAYGVVLDGDTYFGIVSRTKTGLALNTLCSLLQVNCDGIDIRNSGLGSAMWINAASHPSLIGSYLVAYDRAAITWFINTQNSSNTDIVFKGHTESDLGDTYASTGLDHTIYFDAANPGTDITVQNLTLIDTKVHAQISILGKSANVDSVNFLNPYFDVGEISRNVEQSLTDDQDGYEFHGFFRTIDTTGQLDPATNFFDISGSRVFVPDATIQGHTDTGNMLIQDGGGRWYKNYLYAMGNSLNDFAIRVYSIAKARLGDIKFNGSVWSFVTGTTTSWSFSPTALYPAVTDDSASIGLTGHRSTVYATKAYIGPADSTIGITSYTGDPNGHVAGYSEGSLCLTPAGTYQKTSGGVTNAGWILG